jgi:hypothetical protein
MKTLIALLLALTISFPAFAVDTAMDGIDLTAKQISQSESLKSDVVKGFAVWPTDRKVVVVSTRDLTEKELKDLRTELIALPDEDTQAVKEALAQAEIDALVDQKKTELAVAALKAEGKLDKNGLMVKAEVLDA